MKTRITGAYRAVRKVVGNPGLVFPLRQPLDRVPDLDGKRLVFIAGLHRSGTSIFHRLLRAHPDTTGFSNTRVPEDEGQYLQSVFERDINHGGPGQFAFDPRAHITEESPVATPENRDLLLRQWGAYYDLRKSLLLEKSPSNLIRTRAFQAMFPGSAFIFIVRHPIPVTLSTHNWTRRSGVALERVFRHWVRANKRMAADMAHIEHKLLLRYEDLAADPGFALARVYEFLGVAPHEAEERVTDQNGKYFARWESGIADKDKLIREFFKVGGGGLLDRFGYEMAPPYAGSGNGGLSTGGGLGTGTE